MFQEGIKINDLNGMGLVVERQDAQEETESLMVQLERLPCSIEGRWTILRALTEFETHLKELTELIRPVAAQLQTEMATLCAMNAEPLAQWEAYFRDHTVDDFQNEMFNTTFLFTETNGRMRSGWGVWSFNPFGTWSGVADPPGADGPPGLFGRQHQLPLCHKPEGPSRCRGHERDAPGLRRQG